MSNIVPDPEAASVADGDTLHVQFLADAAAELFMTLDVSASARDLANRLCGVLELGGFFYYRTVDAASRRMELASCRGIEVDAAASIRSIRFGELVCGTVALNREPAVLETVQASTDPKTRVLRRAGVRAYVCFPLLSRGTLFGTLSFFRRDADRFARSEVALLRAVCTLVATAWDRSRADAALRDSEARFRTLAELSPDAMLISVKSRYVYANPAAARLLGAEDPREVVGRSTFDFIAPEYHDAVRQRARRVLEERLSNPPFAYRALRLDGSGIDVEAASAHTIWEGGSAVQVVMRDVTERRRAEEALREAKDSAERANEAKTRFLSTVSHELRTPLTAVIGLADLMATEVVGPMTPRQRDYLNRIRISAWHLVAIIDEILTFSRSESGREEIRLSDVDVADVARGVVVMLGRQAQVRDLVLDIECQHDHIVSFTDGGKVRQILVNLVGNAIRYTDRGGVHVAVRADEEWFEFVIRDTGRGIPADRLDDIFEPFVQVVGPGELAAGTGLGLTICRRLASLLGGTVTVQSEVGRGSVFTARLPRRVGATDGTGSIGAVSVRLES